MNKTLFGDPYSGFIILVTVIMISILFSRLVFKRCTILWKSALISYFIFVAYAAFAYIETIPNQMLSFFQDMILYTIGLLILVPSMLIHALIFSYQTCPSSFSIFICLTFSFLFYMFIIWGIMKFIKKYK
jgi:hypothetical protein